MHVAAHISRDAPHTGVTHLPVAEVIVAGHGRGPLKALLAPLVATFNALLGTVSDDVGWHLVTAQGRLPAFLCRAEHDRPVTGGVLGDDVARLLERVPEEVSTSALLRAPRAALG
jgi:hypothetical protein